MKFTGEQYKKLVSLQKEYFSNNVLYPDKDYKSLVGTIRIDEKRLYNFIVSYGLENQTVAIMNPLTREWAHDRFVEEEKKYVWGTQTIKGVRYVLVKKDGVYSMKDRYSHYYEAIPLTETEVKSLKFLDFSELYPEEVE